jgi:hypothetical protein
MTALQGGVAVAGLPVGVLCLKSRHPLMPGNVQHAQSFSAPVAYHAIDLADPWPLMRGDPALTGMIVEGVEALAAQGVGAVVGACGSFAYYQKAVAATAPVPTFLSIMTQAPFLLQGLAHNRTLGVICAVRESMNPQVFERCGISTPERLRFAALSGRPHFDRLMNESRLDDVDALRGEALDAAAELAADPSVGAILLQCSELPPFAADIQAHFGLSVFDMSLMVEWLIRAVDRPAYRGMSRLARF